MRCLRRGFRFAALASVLAAARPVSADVGTAPAVETLAPGAEVTATPRAVIALVGAPEQTSALEALLGELLERDGVGVVFEYRARFEPREVLVGGEAEAGVFVFVDLSAPDHARLYFRGPRAERFLLRRVALSAGLDDVGREQLGQVIETATASLLAAAPALSREQAREAIEGGSFPEAETAALAAPATESSRPPPPAATAGAAPRPSVPPQPGAGTRVALEYRLALRYGFELLGPALGARHGPGLDLGVERRRDFVLGVNLTLERGFAQRVRVSELHATQQAYSARLALVVGARLGARHLLAVGLGAGLDVARLEPSQPHSADVTPAAPATYVTPVLRSELRYELSVGKFLFAAAAFVDLAPQKMHFDLAVGDEQRRLASAWSLRPGAALVAGVRFGQ